MSNVITIQTDETTKIKIKAFYDEFKIENNSLYIEFQAKIEDCTITVYTSNKVVFQGKNAEYESSIWQTKTSKWKYTYNHIGSDEVGTGDYFGPICVAACYVKSEDIEFLDSLQVGDSKTISDENILKIAPKLIAKLPYSSFTLDNEKFNELTLKGFNMNMLKAYLHNQAIYNLRKKLNKQEAAIIDQFCEEKLYYNYLKNQKNVAKDIVFTTKGESLSPSIAASSIIARYSFLKKMQELGDKYQTIIPKGAGSQVDIFAKNFYLKFGKEEYLKVVKYSFKNTQKVMDLLNNN